MKEQLFSKEDEAIKVILVDQDDKELGVAGKIAAHQEGALHRAFSIFLFNEHGQTLIQKRSVAKYHSGGLWANTCCGHPIPGEEIHNAAQRRLFEELYINTPLFRGFTTKYQTNLNRGLIEHEFVHMFFGYCDLKKIRPNPKEVMELGWIDLDILHKEAEQSGSNYSYWLKFYLSKHLLEIKQFMHVALERDVSNY